MASAWVHATIDLLAFGRPYFDLHGGKDKAHEILGPCHRIVNHDWYWEFEKLWTFSDPFPYRLKESIQMLKDAKGADRAEERMVSDVHDYLDRIWDDLLGLERKYWEAFFAWLLFNPRVLKDWGGVDVLNGKIHRVVDGQEMWEDCPATKSEYERLCRYVEVVKSNDKSLQEMLERYG